MYVQVDAAGADAQTVLAALPGVTGVTASPTQRSRRGYEVDERGGPRRAPRARVDGRQPRLGLLELRPMRMSLEDIFLSLTTEETAAAAPAEAPMNNVLAIARKELKSLLRVADRLRRDRFLRPDLRLLLLRGLLLFFERQSMQMAGLGGGPAVNINEQLIRPVFQNAMVMFLFILPMITMRTYSEEKRSGTIELLLTSPLTDLQIILGKFLGAMGLYAAMLAITLIHVVLLFWVGNPEWMPIAHHLSRAAAHGRLLHCRRPAHLEPDQEPDRRRRGDLRRLPDAVGDQLDRAVHVAEAQALLNYLSITDHFDDFTRGVIDTKHVVYYVSFIAFGLFLTARSVDTERWRG